MANNRDLSQFANTVGYNSGNIGIGTATPGAILEVFDATSNTIVNVKSGDSGAVLNLIDDSARSSIEQNGTTLKISSDTGAEDASSDIRLQADGSTKMLIDDGGKVTITSGTNSGAAPSGGDNLVIKDSNGCGLSILSGNGNSQNIYLGSVSDNDVVRLEGFYNSGSPYFNIYTAGSERLRITSAGSIGISSATPKTDLDVSTKTGAVALPQGTTAQRPTGSAPYIRKNTTNNALEYFDGTSWVEIITDYFPTGSVILG